MKNVVVRKVGKKGRGVFASRDFRKGETVLLYRKGEEIAYDCAINNSYDVRQKCFCGSKECRGLYPLSFFKLDKRLQKKYLPYLDTWFKKLYKKKLREIKKAVKEDVGWSLRDKGAKS